MELDFDKYCVVDGSPTTVLPSPGRRPKIQKRKSKGYATRENSLLSLEEDFHVISFSRYRSSSCKTVSSRTVPVEYSDARKRGSVCQSSKEPRLTRKTDASEGRKKIELSERSAATLSFGIVDSLCSSDEDNLPVELDRSLSMSLNLESSTSTTSNSRERLHNCDFLDLPVLPASRRGVPSHDLRKASFDMDSGENQLVENGVRESLRDSKINSRPVILPLNDGNSLGGKEAEAFLHKSLSAKLAFPHSPARSESDFSRASSPKTRFGPVRKVLDPFVKSKSQRSPLGSLREQQREVSTGSDNINRNKTFQRKALLHDFSNTGQQMEYKSCPVNQCHNQPVQSSPAHLQALLKFDGKHGPPILEFSVKSPEDVFVARTWKVENASDWVYTFHSTPEKRRSNASGRGAKESKKGSSLMGQMQVSGHLCTELKDGGNFEDSMVTEFILYDVAHTRSTSSNDSSLRDTGNLLDIPAKNMTRGQLGQVRHSDSSDSSTSHPLDATYLHPHCEAAAIVVQLPLGKRESLKHKNGDKKLEQRLSGILHSCDFKQRDNEQLPDCSSPAKVNIVIPSGNHSLPTTESHGPSPLLDRWRLGGGCDCGGWDMACPLNIFVNPDIQISGDHHHLMESERPLELFIQGRKENTPAFTMTMIEEGHYMVNFHAQLSTLQAFSICIAILHTAEPSPDMRQVEKMQLLQSNSIKVYTEKEVKNLTEAVTDEDKLIVKKKVGEALPSFIVNPPFSPIARV